MGEGRCPKEKASMLCPCPTGLGAARIPGQRKDEWLFRGEEKGAPHTGEQMVAMEHSECTTQQQLQP